LLGAVVNAPPINDTVSGINRAKTLYRLWKSISIETELSVFSIPAAVVVMAQLYDSSSISNTGANLTLLVSGGFGKFPAARVSFGLLNSFI
jgi:hypothetical protein